MLDANTYNGGMNYNPVLAALDTGANAGIMDLFNYTAAGNSVLSNANNEAQQQYTNAINLLQPFTQTSYGALNQLQNLLGLGNNTTALQSLQNTPGYQFANQQGLNAVQNNFAAQGMLNSGANEQALANYSNGLASQTYQSAIGNALNYAGLGLQASGQAANTYNQSAQGYLGTGNAINENYTNMAGNLANIQVGQGSAIAAYYNMQNMQSMASGMAGNTSRGYNQGLINGMA